MRTRTMAGVALTACVALAVGACGPGKSKESEDGTGATSSRPPASPTKARTPSATPSSASPRTAKPSPSSAGATSAPRTTAGAIQRYEVFLHAVGREDIDTVCEVAGPAAKRAEDEGLGPCTSTFLVTFTMISPAQKKALRTATVDPRRVVVHSPAKVEIPAGAVKASMTFSEDEIGDSVMEYLKNDWYVTD